MAESGKFPNLKGFVLNTQVHPGSHPKKRMDAQNKKTKKARGETQGFEIISDIENEEDKVLMA